MEAFLLTEDSASDRGVWQLKENALENILFQFLYGTHTWVFYAAA